MAPRPKTTAPKPTAQQLQVDPIELQFALEHIDRIYGEKILHSYGLGLVTTAVADQFNDFMNLTPPSDRPRFDLSKLLLGALTLLQFTPAGWGKALYVIGTTASVVVSEAQDFHVGETLSETSDVGLDRALQNAAVKIPFFQQVYWLRYDLEHQRHEARDNFLHKLQDSNDAAIRRKPIELARQLYGEAPAKLDRKAVYNGFMSERHKLFKQMVKLYVSQYVTIVKNLKQFRPGGGYESEYYGLWMGLNAAQWRYLYSLYGKQADPAERIAIFVRLLKLSLPTGNISKADFSFPPAADPTLSGIDDLWKQWGAKLIVWQQSWYGGNTIIDRPGANGS